MSSYKKMLFCKVEQVTGIPQDLQMLSYKLSRGGLGGGGGGGGIATPPNESEQPYPTTERPSIAWAQ